MKSRLVGPFKLDSPNLRSKVSSLLSEIGPTAELVGLVHRTTGEFYLSNSLTIGEMEEIKRAIPLLPLSDEEMVRRGGKPFLKSYIEPSNLAFGVLVNNNQARETYFITKANIGTQLKTSLQKIESVINVCQRDINAGKTALLAEEKQVAPAKTKVMLFVNVYKDGTGDFIHFVDFYKKFITDEKYKNCEFIPVISCAVEQFDKIQPRLRELNIPKYYFFKDEIERYDENAELKKDLREAKQVFLISHSRFPYLSYYLKHMNFTSIRKFIGEHEAPLYYSKLDLKMRMDRGKTAQEKTIEANNYVTRKFWEGYSMGLFIGEPLGIKLNNDIKRLSTKDALLAIQEDKVGQLFVNEVLKHSGTEIDTFQENNTLIPAYFNKITPLARFLELNSMHDPAKNPSIYFSGLEMDAKAINELIPDLKRTQIKQVEIIKPGQEKEIINCNAAGQIVRIYCGFNLGNNAYKKLYAQTKFAGVSGDNTLEMAISSGAFPFYHSTNYYIKFTHKGLCENVLSKIDFIHDKESLNKIWWEYKRLVQEGKAEEAELKYKEHGIKLHEEWAIKNSFIFYFTNLAKFNTALTDELAKEYSELNFPRMLEHWPKIVNYIFKNCNYYDKLPKIFFENIPQPREENAADLRTAEWPEAPKTPISTAHSKQGFFVNTLKDEIIINIIINKFERDLFEYLQNEKPPRNIAAFTNAIIDIIYVYRNGYRNIELNIYQDTMSNEELNEMRKLENIINENKDACKLLTLGEGLFQLIKKINEKGSWRP